MSDYSVYHALGHGPGGPGDDPMHQKTRTQPAGPQFTPPIAPAPVPYQQSGSSYGNVAPTSQQAQYGVSPHFEAANQDGGNITRQVAPQYASQGPGPVGGLASQMGGLGIRSDTGGTVRGHKKKHRHAYHDLGTPSGSSQAFNGMPQGGVSNPSQYLNSGQPQQLPAGTPYTFQQSPGMPQNQGIASPQLNSHSQAPMVGSGEGSVSAQGRVDPEQIPSIPKSRDGPAQYYFDHIYPTMERHLPPPAAIPFVAHDQGNSSPKFARLTLNHIPSSSESLSSTGLPLGLILQPLAPLQEGEQPIPVLDFGEMGPPRCRRCRTYINPFMTFRSGGNKLVCNMCTFPNEVSPDYFAPIDPSGVRVDRMQRPELMMGTVEFLVPKEYWAKEPVGLRWLFLIDVSQEAVNRGFLDAFCEGVLGALYGNDEVEGDAQDGDSELPRNRIPAGSRVGIVTFDKEVHFYNLSVRYMSILDYITRRLTSLPARLEQAQMMVMTDLEDPFVPLSEGLLVDPYESKAVITSLLTQLPNLFSQIKNPEPALLPTINAALSALVSTGGKIVCSLAALPTWGPGRLFLRDDGKGQGTDAEKKLFTTEHPGWKKTASKMVESGVGIDLFLAAAGGGYMDIATTGHVAAMSGGETFFYPNFHSPRDALKLSLEIKHTVNRETGYQALMKVRCSNGLQVSSYHGNFVQHTFGADLELGTIDADKAMGVLFSYDGKLETKLDAHFQAALLYTTASGQRRVRCCNIVAGVNDGAIETMKFIDQDAVVSIIAKEASSKMGDKSLKDIRGGITEKTVDILAGYRKNFSGSHPPGQLVLPENLKEFSMYMLSLIKSRAFKGGHEPTDRRVHDDRLLRSIGCTETSLYLYPRILPIHNLRQTDGFPNTSGQLQLPPALRASFSKIEEGGAYLVDNGQMCLLWIHAQVSPNLLEDLFGEGKTTLKSLDPFMSSFPVLETHLNAQVRNLMQYLSTVRGSKALTLQLARQGLDGSEFEFARLLVEDRNNEAQSYVDWLVHIHRHIQLELAGQRKKEDGSGGGVEGTLAGLTGMKPPYW